MTEDQIIRQILQGGGNMPAYGKALNPAETKALTSFLMTLHGHQAPARDASLGTMPQNGTHPVVPATENVPATESAPAQ
jgi:ubiquinol-cytochrome c reductase cytochrome b subunit